MTVHKRKNIGYVAVKNHSVAGICVRYGTLLKINKFTQAGYCMHKSEFTDIRMY